MKAIGGYFTPFRRDEFAMRQPQDALADVSHAPTGRYVFEIDDDKTIGGARRESEMHDGSTGDFRVGGSRSRRVGEQSLIDIRAVAIIRLREIDLPAIAGQRAGADGEIDFVAIDARSWFGCCECVRTTEIPFRRHAVGGRP